MFDLFCVSLKASAFSNAFLVQESPKERFQRPVQGPTIFPLEEEHLLMLLCLFFLLFPHGATPPEPVGRSDGSLIVANREKEEKVMAPPGCGASIAYRVGHYNILLPKTTHSEEKLVIYRWVLFQLCCVCVFVVLVSFGVHLALSQLQPFIFAYQGSAGSWT